MEEERLSLQSSAAGVSLEQVLVFETVVAFDCQANLLPGLVEAPALPRRGLTGGGDWGLFGGMAGLDLFISYSGKDRPWAVWLDFVLREAGYSTKLQEYDFVPGESFPAVIHEALVHSRFVVCLLSPAYLESWWCGEEWQTALAKKNLFPVRIAECKPDGLLTIHAYVDVAGASEAEAEKRILEGLAKREGKDVRPKDRPDFPRSRRRRRRSGRRWYRESDGERSAVARSSWASVQAHARSGLRLRAWRTRIHRPGQGVFPRTTRRRFGIRPWPRPRSESVPYHRARPACSSASTSAKTRSAGIHSVRPASTSRRRRWSSSSHAGLSCPYPLSARLSRISLAIAARSIGSSLSAASRISRGCVIPLF